MNVTSRWHGVVVRFVKLLLALYTRKRRHLDDYRRFSVRVSRMLKACGVREIPCRVNDSIISIRSDDYWAIRRFCRFDVSYDQDEINILREYFCEGSCFWDVGANYGVYATCLGAGVDDTKAIVAIEPSLATFKLLERNLSHSLAKARDVLLLITAVSDEVGTGKLFYSDLGSADARTYEPSDNDVYNDGCPRKSTDVGMRTLSNIHTEFGLHRYHRHVVKLDVQGAEMRALRGAEGLIRAAGSCVILMEFWPHGLVQSGSTPEQVLEFFAKHGFSLYDVHGVERPYSWLDEFARDLLKSGGFEMRNALFVNDG
jgi:FkbM family methyltransferase